MSPETERDIGRLEGKVEALETLVSEMSVKLDKISEYMAETKGSWKTLLALAGIASAVGSALTWFLTKLLPTIKP